MSVYLYPIVTAVPEASYLQCEVGERTKRHLGKGDRKTERFIHYLYSQSGIEKRHSAIKDFLPDAPAGLYYDRATDTLSTPTTGERNRLYTETASEMAPQLAKQAIERCPGITASDITHLVTASCTGFFQPGIDYLIVRQCGLSTAVQRYHLGFMGCYAAFPALKLAQTICRADPKAVVLVQCLELCSLHLQFDSNIDNLLGGSVFADGAASAIVSARTDVGTPAYSLERFDSTLTPVGEEDMAWTIGDRGFVMRLSTYVPEILQNNIAPVIDSLVATAGLQKNDIDQWAIHPGGRAILDKVQSALDLCDASLVASRQVLREYGNMSSATILFVLKSIQERGMLAPGEPVLACAFGPGLTVESGVLRGV